MRLAHGAAGPTCTWPSATCTWPSAPLVRQALARPSVAADSRLHCIRHGGWGRDMLDHESRHMTREAAVNAFSAERQARLCTTCRWLQCTGMKAITLWAVRTYIDTCRAYWVAVFCGARLPSAAAFWPSSFFLFGRACKLPASVCTPAGHHTVTDAVGPCAAVRVARPGLRVEVKDGCHRGAAGDGDAGDDDHDDGQKGPVVQ